MLVNKPSLIPSDLDISEGTILGNSYRVESILREGSFGFVTKCLNTKNNKTVAVKINKNDPEILLQAKQELFILEQLRSLDPDRCNIVKSNGFFLDRECICMDFELLDQSLYNYMKDHNFQGLPIGELRPILYQLANALSHLSSIGIIHTDLKPVKVMVVDRHQSPNKVKIIDFGLACPVSAVVPGDSVQTIWYKAPEVLLHAAFNQAIDMWSLGLIAAELATGLPLYPGETEFDVLRFIIETQGQPPDCVLDRGFVTDRYFIKQNYSKKQWRFKSVEQFQSETGFQPQDTRCFKLKSLDDLERIMKMRTGHHSGQDLLVSLIKQMLHLDSRQRITPLEVLQHPFFDSGLSQNSSRDICIDMENTEDSFPLSSLVPSQQPSHCQSQSRHSIDSSVQNPVELPQASPLSMSVDMPSVPSDLDISEGTILGNSYKVESILGQGGFGVVTKCLNTKNNKTVAVKINKNDPEILLQAKEELFILEQLRSLDPDRCNIVKWNGFFLDRERVCMDFEQLDQDLCDYMEERKNGTLPISEVRPILYQLANALSHLSSVGIIHADLKTDNVMVVDRHQSPIKVKIIDFGLACPVSAVVPGDWVQTMWYKAPEVLLHAAFNQAIDMWSLGLIAAELATGLPLYPGETEFDVLRFIIETQGQPPDCVLDRGFVTDRYFKKQNYSNQRWRFKSVEQYQYETGLKPQDTRYFELGNLDDLEHLMAMRTGYHSGQDLLVSLIKQMLHLDSRQRITPLEVLHHPFFDSGLSQNSSRDICIEIEKKEDQSLVPSQQPSHCQSQSRHSIDSSVQNSFEFPELSQFIFVDMPAISNDIDISMGTILGNSYIVESILGDGGFGFVTKCLNTKNNKTVAVKINKNDPEKLEQAKQELFILKQLRSLDPDKCNIMKWNGFFLDGERICIDFELLDQSLFDYMKDRNFQGLPISEVRPILYQLANALSHLSSIGIIHADLKTDNVMVVDRHQSPIKVKIIDFGLACLVSAVVPGDWVQTRWYKAPEVLLHAAFNQAIDMWSLGLIAAELATGVPLYPGEMEFDVLRFIIETQGQPPDCVLDRGFVTDRYFKKQNYSNQRWRFKSVEQFQYETGFQPQDTRCFKIRSLDDLERIMKMKSGHHSGQDLLVSLIKQMLHLDSRQRITPLEVLQHPFFDSGLSQNSSRDICIEIEKKEDQSLVSSQQPSHCQSQSRHSIDCRVQNPVELPQASPLSMSVDMPSVPSDIDISMGTILGNSHKVESILGQGGFGFVTKCLNTKNNKTVAVKVNKNNPEKLKQAKLELFILKQLRSLDPDRCNIVKWNGFFLDRERVCMDFEQLDQSLFDYRKDHKFKTLPISEVRPILYQLANALSHLSSIGIIHADLKPVNIMVVNRRQSPIKVKIIDFGLACPVSAVVPGDWVQTMWYKAPEVLLHAAFNQAIDMWSLGLIAAELATGVPLYPGEIEFDVLRSIIETQGQPPDCVLDRGFVTDRYFIKQNYSNQRWRFKSVEQFQYETGFQPQATRYFKRASLDDLELVMKMRTGHHSGQDLLVSLIKQMLHLDSRQRITPLEVLHHPFFDSGLSQNSSRDILF